MIGAQALRGFVLCGQKIAGVVNGCILEVKQEISKAMMLHSTELKGSGEGGRYRAIMADDEWKVPQCPSQSLKGFD